MAGFVFNRGALNLQNNTSIIGTSVFKARPVLASAEAAVSKDATVMTSLGSTGYDVTLTMSRQEDTTNDRIVYDCTDFVFTSVAAIGAIDHFIVFVFNTNDADSVPHFKVAMTSVTPNGGNVNVTVSASGLAYTQQ